MRVLPLVLCSVITLAIGLLIGVEIAGGSTEAHERDVPVATDRGNARSDSEVDRRRAEVSSGVSRQASMVKPRSPAVDPQVESAIRRYEAPEVEASTGDGVIRGRVALVDGTGLPDATLIVQLLPTRAMFRRDPDLRRAAPEPRTLDEALRAAAESWAMTEGNTRRVRSGTEGNFEVVGLVDGDYRITAYCEGFQIESGNSPMARVSTGGFANFTATPLRVATFDLRLPDGSQPESATLVIDPQSRGRSEQYAWSPDAPQCAFTTPTVRIRAGAEPIEGRSLRDGAFRFESDEMSIESGGSDPIRIDLEPIRGIEGLVVFDGDDAEADIVLSEAQIALVPLEHAGVAFTGLELESDSRSVAGAMQSTGLSERRFHFVRIAPGAYGVALRVAGQVRSTAVVEVADSLADCQLRLEPSGDFGFLAVTVRAPDGSPLTGLQLSSWVRMDGGRQSSHGLRLRSMPDGRLGISFAQLSQDFPFNAWPTGASMALNVSHSHYGQQRVDLRPGQTELDLIFQEPAVLLVEVPEAVGSPILSRLQISLSPLGEEQRLSGWSSGLDGRPQLDSEGRYRFTGVVPGGYELSVRINPGNWRSVQLASHELTLAPGEQSFVVRLPPLHDVTVRFPGVEERTPVTLRRDTDPGDRSTWVYLQSAVGADGTATFQYMPAGQYQVSSNGSSGSMQITVPTGGEVLFTAEGPDCLRVAIADESGSLFQAGLRSGDTIVRIDDTDLSVETLNQASRSLYTGNPRLELLRNGERITITLSGTNPFADRDRAGGTVIQSRR